MRSRPPAGLEAAFLCGRARASRVCVSRPPPLLGRDQPARLLSEDCHAPPMGTAPWVAALRRMRGEGARRFRRAPGAPGCGCPGLERGSQASVVLRHVPLDCMSKLDSFPVSPAFARPWNVGWDGAQRPVPTPLPTGRWRESLLSAERF